MKKNLWIWALAAFSMAACTSEDAPTPEQVVTENDWISPDGQVVVQLSANELPTPTASLGRAIIDGTNISSLTDLGIFALGRNGGYNANPDTDNNILLYNVRGEGKTVTTLDPELHKDDQGNVLKRISLYNSQQNKTDQIASIYYYPIQPKNNYDFYGYFPRQEDVNVSKQTNEITVQFTATNGDMDIITGQAEKAPQMAIGSLFINEETSNNTNTTPLDGYNAKYIRSIKYHNWLLDEEIQSGKDKKRFVPNIKFNHRTTLLKFFIIPNDEQAGSTTDNGYNDQQKTKELRVKNIALLETNSIATWSVTANTMSWSNPDSIAMIPLDKNNGAWDAQNDNLMIPAESESVAEQAGYLMVEPKESYTLSLTIVAPTVVNSNAVPKEQTTHLTIKQNTQGLKFEEGYSYNIYIQLNALQEVNIHAELTDWIDVNTPVYVPVE